MFFPLQSVYAHRENCHGKTASSRLTFRTKPPIQKP
jgi:hypothetical protein